MVVTGIRLEARRNKKSYHSKWHKVDAYKIQEKTPKLRKKMLSSLLPFPSISRC